MLEGRGGGVGDLLIPKPGGLIGNWSERLSWRICDGDT